MLDHLETAVLALVFPEAHNAQLRLAKDIATRIVSISNMPQPPSRDLDPTRFAGFVDDFATIFSRRSTVGLEFADMLDGIFPRVYRSLQVLQTTANVIMRYSLGRLRDGVNNGVDSILCIEVERTSEGLYLVEITPEEMRDRNYTHPDEQRTFEHEHREQRRLTFYDCGVCGTVRGTRTTNGLCYQCGLPEQVDYVSSEERPDADNFKPTVFKSPQMYLWYKQLYMFALAGIDPTSVRVTSEREGQPYNRTYFHLHFDDGQMQKLGNLFYCDDCGYVAGSPWNDNNDRRNPVSRCNFCSSEVR